MTPLLVGCKPARQRSRCLPQPLRSAFGAAISATPDPAAYRPLLDDLDKALQEAEPFLEAARTARGTAYINHEGGDVGGHATERALYRHVANYLAAVELGEAAGLRDAVLDVGSGTGALGAWVASRLGARLLLVDRAESVRRVAQAAFPDAEVHAELDEVPAGTVGLVTAMEVLEHIAPSEQRAFVEALVGRVEPGGLLVLSTPDESGYVGGWSGYAPHIGCVTALQLETLLSDAAPGAHVRVWRMHGDAFHLGKVRRVIHPLANRLWTRIEPAVAPVTHRLIGPATAIADLARTHAGPELAPKVTAIPPSDGEGTGLIGVVAVPA